MHVATKGELLPGQEQEHVAGPGRPKGPITGKSHKSPFGRDPLGAKQLGKSLSTDKSPLQHKFRGGGPLNTESKEINNLINSMQSIKKSSKIIQETMSEKSKDTDKGTMLDETQLIQ